MSRLTRLPINTHMVTQVTRETADVVIFTQGTSVENYRVTYELRVTLTTEIETAIENTFAQKLQLGAELSRCIQTCAALRKKATLMQNIFENEYGLTSVVVSLIIPEDNLVPNIGTAVLDDD